MSTVLMNPHKRNVIEHKIYYHVVRADYNNDCWYDPIHDPAPPSQNDVNQSNPQHENMSYRPSIEATLTIQVLMR